MNSAMDEGRKRPGGSVSDRESSNIIHASLCDSCEFGMLVETPRSRFLLCGRSKTDPAYPRYPSLPVLSCKGYEERRDESERGK